MDLPEALTELQRLQSKEYVPYSWTGVYSEDGINWSVLEIDWAWWYETPDAVREEEKRRRQANSPQS